MKKLIIALVAITSIASADLFINLKTSYGFTDLSNGADATLLNVGETALIQLIDAGSDGIDAVTAAGGGMFGNDVLLHDLEITATSDHVNDFTGYAFISAESVSIDNEDTNSANVFARIYKDSTASAGSLYYDGAIVVIPGVTFGSVPPPTATAYDFGGLSGVDAESFATVIPEPATIGLLGIAAAGLFTARRKVRV